MTQTITIEPVTRIEGHGRVTIFLDDKGKVTAVDTEIGKGQANYVGLFAAIKQAKWSGVMAIETDSKAFAEDPNRLVSEAKSFFAASTARK